VARVRKRPRPARRLGAGADELLGRAARARFQLKVLDWSRIAGRPDALVAFTGAADLDAAIRCAVRIGAEGWLEAATPGFATGVAPGVAIAPEPASAGHAGRSYGQACARSAAEASIDAWRRGVDCEERRASIIAERLERDLAPAPPIPLEERA
jgi:hypothetical protein